VQNLQARGFQDRSDRPAKAATACNGNTRTHLAIDSVVEGRLAGAILPVNLIASVVVQSHWVNFNGEAGRRVRDIVGSRGGSEGSALTEWNLANEVEMHMQKR